MAENRTPLTHIVPETPVKEFPDCYNADIDELVSRIDRLTQLIGKQNQIINELHSTIYNLTGNVNSPTTVEETNKKLEKYLDARYKAMFDKKMDEFDGKFNSKMLEFKEKFVKKTDN